MAYDEDRVVVVALERVPSFLPMRTREYDGASWTQRPATTDRGA